MSFLRVYPHSWPNPPPEKKKNIPSGKRLHNELENHHAING